MIVKNGKCIRRLSFKTLLSSGKRNIIAIIAIALTTLMFTAIFTVALSFNSSYQNYLARQLGGYSHGAFKEVNEEQIEKISAHKKIKETGVRTVIGLAEATPFDKETAEVSYMDDNCTKWSFALPCEGRTPEKEDEISMDRRALELLGAEGTLGEKITVTYNLYGINGEGGEITDTFTLCGIFEYDDLLPVHFINISKDYMEKMRKTALESRVGDFRTDLNVMLSNSFNIENRLIEIGYDLGFTDVRVGASWAYTASSFSFASCTCAECRSRVYQPSSIPPSHPPAADWGNLVVLNCRKSPSRLIRGETPRHWRTQRDQGTRKRPRHYAAHNPDGQCNCAGIREAPMRHTGRCQPG